jgi:CBS domain-containing protein
MEEVVHNQISNFLMNHLPFSFLRKKDLVEISKQSSIKFVDKGEIIFKEGDPHIKTFYVIQQGSIELLYQDGIEEKLSEICDVGDIFGLKAIIGNRVYINTSKAHEESLLIQIPFHTFQNFIESEPKIAMYFAAGFSSGRALRNVGIKEVETARKNLSNSSERKNTKTPFREEDSLPVYKERKIISCGPDTKIKDAALLMNQNKVGSILIVDTEQRPLGIVTDVDFRKKVVADSIPLDKPVSEIMSFPVLTVNKEITFAKTIITMMQKNIRHLCITKDGTSNTAVIGIVTEHDILILQGNNPAVIAKEILSARNLNDLPALREKAEILLEEYLHQELSMEFILDIITEVNDALIIRIIDLNIQMMIVEGFGKPPVPFSWISLGSEGRKEQALRTDQDNAIVFENDDDEKFETIQKYFLELGARVTKSLNDCGFKFCPGEIMASNPKWCTSLTKWKTYFEEWIYSTTPQSILNFSIFFDFRSVYGNKNLVEDLDTFIQQKLKENQNALRFLAINAISNSPPLGLFRGFVVDKSGKHKNQFDIKARGTMPLADGARVLALEIGIKERNTIERYKKLSEHYPKLESEYKELAVVFEIISRFRTNNTLKNPTDGNYINPDNLNKIEKETLKHAFRIIQELQKRIEIHFQLNLIPK